MQFAQFLSQSLGAQRSYTASVWLRSASPMVITLQLRQNDAPYQTYAGNLVTVRPT